MKLLALLSAFFLFTTIHAQKPSVQILCAVNDSLSLRGLSVVNDNVIWVSGTQGKVGRSNNGGKNWKWMTVKGFEATDFRDIEAFDASTAVIIAIDSPAYILKTTDGGDTWKVVYENHRKGMFLDAMHFTNDQKGIVIGDPIDNKAFVAATDDGGDTWKEWTNQRPALDSGEAFFAASGTNIHLMENGDYFAVSGGMVSRLISNQHSSSIPIVQGTESAGANSIDIYDAGHGKGNRHMIVVGGDFYNIKSSAKNCWRSNDGGKTWKASRIPPAGYRSCVEYLSKTDVLTCGLTGVDYSHNGGSTWEQISKDSFHVCKIAKLGTAIYLAGNKGRIAKIVWK